MSGATNILAFFGYTMCLIGIAPVAILAIFFFFVKQAANFKWAGSLGGLILKILEFLLDAPVRILVFGGIMLIFVGVFIAMGARESWRGYGLAAIAVTGVVSIAYVWMSASSIDSGQVLFLLPSAIACVVSGYLALREF